MLFVYFDNENSTEAGYSLILASNRDEFLKRPTKDAHFWSDYNDCIGGVDDIGGGTWLAAAKTGKIGVLLNISSNIDPDKPTRGSIVKNYVSGTDDPKKYLEACSEKRQTFNPYNLVLFNKTDNNWNGYYHCNKETKPYHVLEPGCHVFGNCPAYKPWQKIYYGKNLFHNIVKKWNNKEKEADLKSELLNMLSDEKKNLPDEALYEQLWMRQDPSLYSSIRVTDFETPYGTRTHTIILVDKMGNIHFEEKTMAEPLSFDNPNWTISKFDF